MSERSVGPTSYYFSSQRLKLHDVDWSNSEARPLVMIHGSRDHATETEPRSSEASSTSYLRERRRESVPEWDMQERRATDLQKRERFALERTPQSGANNG